MNATVTITGGDQLGYFLAAAGSRVQKGSVAITYDKADRLQELVRAHASGRPGPNKISGKYLMSIKIRHRGFGAEVYSDAAQAWRLEAGFVGIDSIGRHYNQPPYPHWEPAVQELEPEYQHALDLMIEAAIRL